MTSLIGANMWLEMFFRNAIQGDMDWVQIDDGSFTYWPGRLAQTTSAEVVSEFGDVKWRVRTRIVEDVGDPARAKEACLALNPYAAGWSFAYDDAEKTVNAIAAVYAPIVPFPNDPMTRVASAAILSAWMSDLIADDLAKEVEGKPAYSHPTHQHVVRAEPDATFYYPEVLRGRPEWVRDLTSRQFPDIGEIGRQLAANLEIDPDWLRVDQGQFIEARLTESGRYRVSAYFADHPIVGQCWRTYLSLPEIIAEYVANAANELAWSLFNDEESSLAGGWTYRGRALAFEQWTTTSEVRQLERFVGFHGHDVSELVGRAASLRDAAIATQNLDWDSCRGDTCLTDSERTQLGEKLIGAVSRLAPQLADSAGLRRGEKLDRRLLWLERRAILVAAAWFNPMGPTLATLEVCGNEGDEENSYLVYFMRHPSSPDYRVIGPINSDEELRAAFADGIRLLLAGGSLPTMMMLRTPEDYESPMATTLYGEVMDTVDENGIDLFSRAEKLSQCMGRPWDLAQGAQPPGLTTKYSVERYGVEHIEVPAPPIETGDLDAGFVAWWKQVAKPENQVAHLAELPDAWDAALSLLMESGAVRHFDLGPYLLRYSDKATVLPSELKN